MNELKATCQSENDLPRAARDLLKFADNRKVFAFFGEMGVGKTTFIKSICIELGIIQLVSSPSFAIVNEYADKDGNPVYHFDFYRIKDEKEALDIGCEEYFDSGNYCFIEWSEKILHLLPENIVRVRMTMENETRKMTFQYA